MKPAALKAERAFLCFTDAGNARQLNTHNLRFLFPYKKQNFGGYKMKNYTDSDYAINKFSKGIVYRFANEVVEITLEDYLAENPDKTENDFVKLKSLSDEMYLDKSRKENNQTRKNVSMTLLEETDATFVPSYETMLIRRIEKESKRQKDAALIKEILGCLTDIQRRRYLMTIQDKMTTRQIAVIDRVSHQSVVECLEAANKKIKKFLSNT